MTASQLSTTTWAHAQAMLFLPVHGARSYKRVTTGIKGASAQVDCVSAVITQPDVPVSAQAPYMIISS